MRSNRSTPATSRATPGFRPDCLARLCRFVEGQGVDRAAVLRQAGLDHEALEDDGELLPPDRARWLIVALQRAAGTPALGLDAGWNAEPWWPASLPTALSACATFREALSLIEHYAGPRSSCLLVRLDGRDDAMDLVIEPRISLGGVRRFVLEHAAASVLRLARDSGHLHSRDLHIELPWPRPAWHATYDRLAGSVRFDAPRLALRFSPAVLDRPHPGASSQARERACRTCDEESARSPANRSMTSRVRSLLEGLDPGVLSIQGMADRLGVSARTTTRHLQAEGTTFQQLLDDVRRRHAAQVLASGDRSVAELALALGYASSANFGRSFRRWFGTTPSGYVRQLRRPRKLE